METKKVTTEMRNDLRKPLPKEAIKQHPTKTFLSTIKAIYVTERLNEVFGVGAWQLRVNHITTTDKSMVVVKVEFSIPEYGIYYECFGGNDNGGENSKNFDLGDAYKGATTDAITKIGSYLEIGIDVFKGKSETPKTTAYNHNTLGTKEKPLISNQQFKSISERMDKGEDLYQKTLDSFTLVDTQKRILEQKHQSLLKSA